MSEVLWPSGVKTEEDFRSFLTTRVDLSVSGVKTLREQFQKMSDGSDKDKIFAQIQATEQKLGADIIQAKINLGSKS